MTNRPFARGLVKISHVPPPFFVVFSLRNNRGGKDNNNNNNHNNNKKRTSMAIIRKKKKTKIPTKKKAIQTQNEQTNKEPDGETKFHQTAAPKNDDVTPRNRKLRR